MSTFTGRLQLKRNDASDPFLRQDFVDNWNKIDAAPGVHICTSSSRPTWGVAQAGRLIQETDTRAQYLWTGTSWLEPLPRGVSWVGVIRPFAVLARTNTYTYTIATITMSRPGTLMVWGYSSVWCDGDETNWITKDVLIDGADSTIGGAYGYLRFAAGPSTVIPNGANMMVMGVRGTLNPGQHTIQHRYTVGSDPGPNMTLRDSWVAVMLVNHAQQ